MDCFFGDAKGSEPYAVRVENADCERYEGAGYALQRWIGGEYTLEEMWIGDEKVYEIRNSSIADLRSKKHGRRRT